MSKPEEVTICKNRRAAFDFFLSEKFTAGIVLTGTEIKSIRLHQTSINEAYCIVHEAEVWIRNMSIEPYEKGGYVNHETRRERKLLLKSLEIKKVKVKLKDKGVTLIPVRLYLNDKGLAKLEISIAKGKKNYDKRETIKNRESAREIARTRNR
jgi:SsrA-binding protein